MTASKRIAAAILRHNRLFALLLALVVAVLAAGIPRLEFSTDNRAFFSRDNPEYRDLLALDADYTGTDGLLFLLVPPKGAAFDPATLEALRDFTDDAWQIPYVLRVDSPVNLSLSRSEGDEILIEPLLPDTGPLTDDDATRFRKGLADLDEAEGRFVSEGGDAFGMSVQLVLPGTEAGRDEAQAHVTGMLDAWRAAHPGWQFRVTGGFLGGLALERIAIEDLTWLVPLAALIVVVILLYMMRTVVGAVTTIVVAVCGTVATLGIAGWTGIVLTAGTAISPLSVLVLLTASCIHIMLSWMRALDGDAPDRAIAAALEENLGAVTVTNLTTAIGFLCLNFSQAPPLRDMGNIIAFGLLVGLAATLVVVPLGLRFDRREHAARIPVTHTMMDRLALGVLRRWKLWLWLFPIGVLVAITGILRIGYDDSIFRYFSPRTEFRQSADAISEKLSGLDSLQFSFEAPEGSVFDPAFLASVDRFANWLETQPEVISVTSIADILKRMNAAMTGDETRRLPDSREANAQLMMLYEFSLPPGHDLTSTIDVSRTKTRLIAGLRVASSNETRDLAARSEAWLARNEPVIATRASGISVAFARLSQQNNRQMLLGLGVVLAAISGIMMLTLRSFTYGVISLVPNLVPAVLAFGLWGYTFRDVNLGSTVVTTMTFGIVVDDTVHFLMHYLRRRRAGLAAEPALRDTFSVVGAAIIITSLALMAGFAVMTLSGFVINRHIGALTVFVVGFALLADLLFLPALLLALKKGRR